VAYTRYSIYAVARKKGDIVDAFNARAGRQTDDLTVRLRPTYNGYSTNRCDIYKFDA